MEWRDGGAERERERERESPEGSGPFYKRAFIKTGHSYSKSPNSEARGQHSMAGIVNSSAC